MAEESIKLNFAFLCDSAFLSEGGKLNIIGIFKNINGLKLPLQHPQMVVVTNININRRGTYKETIKLIRKKDNLSIVSPLEFNISTADDGKKEFGIIGQLANIKFDEVGSYAIQILINETVINELPLMVNIITPKQDGGF